jgi:peptide/nickel transport system ATP-binding protein
MYAGRIVESGPAGDIFAAPRHPYTRALLACAPTVEEHRFPFVTLPGSPPNALDGPIPGCAFHPRCARASVRCAVERPAMESEGARAFACWNALPSAAEPPPRRRAL